MSLFRKRLFPFGDNQSAYNHITKAGALEASTSAWGPTDMMHFAASTEIQAASLAINHAIVGTTAGAKIELGVSLLCAAMTELGSASRAYVITRIVARLTQSTARRFSAKPLGTPFKASRLPAAPFIRAFSPASLTVH